MKKMGFGSARKLAKASSTSTSTSASSTSDAGNKAVLFGNAKPAGAANPYANMGAGGDPYAAREPAPTPPPQYEDDAGGTSRFRQDKSGVPAGGYGGGGGRYGSGGASYAEQGGYGSNRVGDEAAAPRRLGGYGGMEEGRQALFGDAPSRYAQAGVGKAPGAGGEYGYGGGRAGGYDAVGGGGGYGSADDRGYGGHQGYGGSSAYGDRQLTAEEQEEEDINATKQEIRFIKQQDVSSTRNALRLAEQAYQQGAATLERLGAQGERIHNTERNLDLASVQNRVAQEKARELKTLNRSMFAVHVGNPFTSERRQQEREAKVLETTRRERDARDASRMLAYESSARQDEVARELRGQPQRGANKASLAERSKYQFEADSEDEDMENEIDDNLDMLSGAVGKLKGLGAAMGREVDEQHRHIGRITGKVDRVDDEIALNRARLDRIR